MDLTQSLANTFFLGVLGAEGTSVHVLQSAHLRACLCACRHVCVVVRSDAATFCCSLGYALPDAQSAWIPMASLASESSGWESLLVALLFSCAAVSIFGKRSALG